MKQYLIGLLGLLISLPVFAHHDGGFVSGVFHELWHMGFNLIHVILLFLVFVGVCKIRSWF